MAKDKEIDEHLRELGIDPAEPERAVDKLRSLRAAGAVDQSRLAAAAGQISSPASAEFLAEMEAGASGPLRREVRRALFRLRQHGVEAPAVVAAPPKAAHSAGESNINALISPIDSSGARLVWMFKARGQGGLSRLHGLTSEQEGLVGAQLTHISRRELREERRDIERRSSIKLVEADYRLADFMLCEAYRRTPEHRRGQVGNFLALRAEILPGSPSDDYRHPIYEDFSATLSEAPSVDCSKNRSWAAGSFPNPTSSLIWTRSRTFVRAPWY